MLKNKCSGQYAFPNHFIFRKIKGIDETMPRRMLEHFEKPHYMGETVGVFFCFSSHGFLYNATLNNLDAYFFIALFFSTCREVGARCFQMRRLSWKSFVVSFTESYWASTVVSHCPFIPLCVFPTSNLCICYYRTFTEKEKMAFVFWFVVGGAVCRKSPRNRAIPSNII